MLSTILSNPLMLKHGLPSHPENATRLQSIMTEVAESPYKSLADFSVSRLATPEELALVHTPEYVNFILSLDGQEVVLDADTILTPGSVKAAQMAAGIGLELVEQIISGKVRNGFALVRPPGHHARPNSAMGFCVFNNIAIAAKKALSIGLKRILILDWDVHHGNGTQEAFYEDDQVLLIDLHQDNLFPIGSGMANQTGKGKGEGFTINIPLSEGCGDAEYLTVFDKIVIPKALDYDPELIIVSAGFDAHVSDPLGGMRLTTQGFGKLTSRIKTVADKVCNGKLALFLEGGYDPYYLAKNVLECIAVLNESP